MGGQGTSHLLEIGVVLFPFSSTSFLLHGRGGSIGAVLAKQRQYHTISSQSDAHGTYEGARRGAWALRIRSERLTACIFCAGSSFIRFGRSRAAAAQQQRTLGPQTRHLLLHLRLAV